MIKDIFNILRDSPSSFEGQREGERIILLLRHHPFRVMVRLGSLGTIALIPILVGLVFFSIIGENGWWSLFVFLTSVLYMMLWISAFHILTMFTLDTVIITNQRIIDNNQFGLFNRKVAEVKYERIQDISAHTKGVIETFLRFGNVVVQTAGVQQKFTFENVPDPIEVKAVIAEASQRHRAKVENKTTADQTVHN